MNILLINHYAGSIYRGMEFRPYYMAKEWVKKGHDVTIIAADYTHLRKENPVIKKDFTEESVDGIRYLFIKTNKYRGNNIGRAFNILAFKRKLMKNAKRLALLYKPDAVIASSTHPLDIYPADKISKIAKARLYFELHDLWPLSTMVIGGLSEKNPIIKYLQKAEDYIYANVDKVISIIPNADKHIAERGFNTPFVHIPNGVILQEGDIIETDEKQIEFLREKKKDGYFIIIYAGNHSNANDLEFFIEASTVFTPQEKTLFVLIGKGNVKPQLMETAKKLRAENVSFLDPVKKESVSTLLSVADVAFIGLKKDKLFDYGVSPNKLFDYMLAAKPIIYAVESSNDPVSDADCGITVPAGSSNAIAQAVRELKAMGNEKLNEMGENGKSFVIKNHKYETLAEKFLKEISE